MLKSNGLHMRLTRNIVVVTVFLLMAISALASGLWLPVKAAAPAQGQDATPTPGSMMDGGMMGQGMSMAEMGAMMDQMMGHMQSMMGTMSMAGTTPMSGTMPMAGTMPMSGTIPMTGMMDSGMMQMCTMMPMGDSMPMTGTMPMTGMMPMSGTMPMSDMMSLEHMGTMMQMMGMMQMHMGCMQMMMGAMMSGSMMGEDMMDNGTMGDQAGMDMPSDVPFDAMFIDSMIEHHQGAIDMAEMALDESEHEELRTLAEDIIAAQTAEIEQLQSWRSEWYPDLDPTGGMQMGMGDMMIGDDESVPFDQRFIEAMISHHQGAIDMAAMAMEQAEHEEIRTLSEDVIAAQTAEIEQMQGWLADWYDVSN